MLLFILLAACPLSLAQYFNPLAQNHGYWQPERVQRSFPNSVPPQTTGFHPQTYQQQSFIEQPKEQVVYHQPQFHQMQQVQQVQHQASHSNYAPRPQPMFPRRPPPPPNQRSQPNAQQYERKSSVQVQSRHSQGPFRQVHREQPQPHQGKHVQQLNNVRPHQRIIQHVSPKAPPPPTQFIPYLSDIFNAPEGSSDTEIKRVTIITPEKTLPDGAFIAEELVVDGTHPSYIENFENSKPRIVVTPSRHVQPASQQRPTTRAQIVQSSTFNQRPRVQQNFRPAQRQWSKPQAPPPQRTAQPRPQPTQPQPTQTRPQPTQTRPQPAPQTRVPAPQPTPQVTRPQPRPPAKKTRPAATVSHLSAAKSENAIFLDCCQKRRVAKSCERICNFDVLSKKTLTGMFLGTDPCPQSHGLDLLQCAAQNDDHTACCIERGVDLTKAGSKCLGFCNMKPGVTFQADVSMLPCWGVLNDIKQCFKDNIVH